LFQNNRKSVHPLVENVATVVRSDTGAWPGIGNSATENDLGGAISESSRYRSILGTPVQNARSNCDV
jgi:hypothetical protein